MGSLKDVLKIVEKTPDELEQIKSDVKKGRCFLAQNKVTNSIR